jgi:hypothetical protein
MYPKPDVEKMGGQELLDVYNRYAAKTRTSKFQNLKEGREAVLKVWNAWAAKNPPKDSEAVEAPAAVLDPPEAVEGPTAQATALMSEEDTMAKPAAKKPAPKAAAKEAPKKAAPKAKEAKSGRETTGAWKMKPTDKIEVVPNEAGKNPHREGSQAAAHWEAAKKAKTVQAYLDKFPDTERKTARQWLGNFIVRLGTVKLTHAPA